MMMTWKPTPVPDEHAFAAIKAGIDALPPGVKMILNSGGCAFRAPSPGQLNPDGSKENLRRSVDTILKALRGTKKLDLFEPARRDPNYEIEHYAEVLNELVKEGKFDYIGLSEVGAETIRRAHKVRNNNASRSV